MAARWTSPKASPCGAPLGASGGGALLPFAALTAIHIAHRLGAAVVLPALLAARAGGCTCAGAGRRRRWALGAARPWPSWQLASGLGNVAARLAARRRGRAHGGRRRRWSSSLDAAAARAARRRVPTRRPPARRARRAALASYAQHRRPGCPTRSAPAAPRSGSRCRQAAPVLRADQAARRPADRLLRGDRHAARDARAARLAARARRAPPASGSSPPRRRRSTAWSSSASTRAWRAPRGAPTATGELTHGAGARLLGAARAPPAARCSGSPSTR